MADSKISDLAAVTDLLTTDEYVLARSGASKKITGANLRAAVQEIGSSVLIYRYTVTGSDKASIDTGSDTADAGTGVWSDGDVLEMFMTVKTDIGGTSDSITVTVNNDTGSNYDKQTVEGSGTAASAVRVAATTGWNVRAHGSGGTAGYPANIQMAIAGYARTVFNKVATFVVGWNDNADGVAVGMSMGWRSTAAITRIKVAGNSGALLKVGTTLAIYKRKAT